MRPRPRAGLLPGLAFVCALVLGAWATPASAAYPERPVTLIVPWAAGGGTDAVARILAAVLEKDLGQSVNVVNRTGGGGAVGHTAGATARPDGYTITMATVEITMMHWMGLAQVDHTGYDAVALVNFDPAGVSVRQDAPWKTIQELNAYVKANPGALKASGTGPGGIWDVARAGWLKAFGLPHTAVPWVPSQGAAPALQEVVAGGIDICTCSLPEAASLIEAGKVRPLAIMADTRDPRFPDVPTLKEIGLDWTIGAWRGITVPKGTPADVIARLERAVSKAVESQEFVEFMRNRGFGILYKDSKGFAAFMREGDAAMGALMKEVGLAK
ncbi:MAG TPA: tripartite tricarboxylate transporter substrate binding protein [Thermodesulfobacteriota bacterium]